MKCWMASTTRGPAVIQWEQLLILLTSPLPVNIMFRLEKKKCCQSTANTQVRSHMLRHSSLPLATASMLIVLTQTHPLPTRHYHHTPTYCQPHICSHTSNITSPGMRTKRHKFSPRVTWKRAHTQNRRLTHERSSWCWPPRVGYHREVMPWCQQCRLHAMCVCVAWGNFKEAWLGACYPSFYPFPSVHKLKKKDGICVTVKKPKQVIVEASFSTNTIECDRKRNFS